MGGRMGISGKHEERIKAAIYTRLKRHAFKKGIRT
ncbi:hypothetical protein PO124_20755 [Bacillus licheniformis]|nr:hypothetical protein [Bacillus licheniformis]